MARDVHQNRVGDQFVVGEHLALVDGSHHLGQQILRRMPAA
jgi:hypothetical protein